ncbi:MAG: hypothetical protein HY665_04290, partial [Chloroflexi bacterium]|nr:hypothetical protein [Chloroflexota bacterium]
HPLDRNGLGTVLACPERGRRARPHKIKRKRGGQKGNQNARKHGFYSGTLGLAEICEFWNITNKEGIDTEIAVLRVKLRSSLQQDPGNRRVLREASKLLAKWYSAKYKLDRTDSDYLNKVIWNILEAYPGSSLSRPDQPSNADR